MWSTRCEQLDGGDTLRLAVDRDGRPATFAEVLTAWQEDAAFRSLFNGTLADSPLGQAGLAQHGRRWRLLVTRTS